MDNITSNSVFIGSEEIEVLRDIKNRCFFPTLKEQNKFFEIVCRSVGASAVHTITEEDFEVAFNVAMSILRNRGEEILRGRLR